MNEPLAEGLSKTSRITVDPPRTIDFMGEECRVYATPELVRDIEITCRDLLLDHVGGEEDSVGTHISIDHMAATPLGMWVDIKVVITELNRKKVRFNVECCDAQEVVAKGEHERFIVDLNKTAERIKMKAANSQ